MLKCELPWQGLEISNSDIKWHKVYKKKLMSTTVLCQRLPPEFREILKYARSLDFFATPDYDRVLALLDHVALRENIELDNIYPWTVSLINSNGVINLN